MLPLREINVMGVFVAPFALCIPAAVAGACGALAALRRLPADLAWTRSPALELALFLTILSGLVLLLGRV
ncbi:hypothetical protein [Methylobacterium sp. ID0610]|uniref:hypothetical protein n=1 Tax=Methylobacterium carpenticola TaxID=3344827 RepID=UPI0036CFA49F